MKCNTDNWNHEYMKQKEIHITSLLKKITRKDTLFKGDYALDPYQNCLFGCIYCDSSYDDTIFIKANAVNVLKDEIKNFSNQRIILGSVHDPYQPIEKSFKITRSILKVLIKKNLPIHILTKSPLILRDLDLLKHNNNIHVTFSFITHDQTISSQIEHNTPTVLQRYNAIQTLHKEKIYSGAALIPILPGIIEKTVDTIIKQLVENHADYLLSQHLFLRGDQKTIFYNFLKQQFPSLLPTYKQLFKDSMNPSKIYQRNINKKINDVCNIHQIPRNLPL